MLRAVQRHPRYTRDRIAQVGERIRTLVRADTRAPDSLRVAGPVDRISHEEAERLDYRDAELGERFGPLWATYWFRVEATVPQEWAGERVDLAVGEPQRGDALDRRAPRPGPELEPRGRPGRRARA